MQVILFDDFLNEEDMCSIETTLSSTYFPWFYIGESSFQESKHGIKDYDKYRSTKIMRHRFYDSNVNNDISEFFHITINPIIKNIGEKTGKKVRLYSALANLLLPNEKYLDMSDIPHIDNRVTGDNAFTGIFYVNDADGDTVFYKTKERFTPKRNRVIYWPASGIHSAPCGCSVPRCVINLNFKLE